MRLMPLRESFSLLRKYSIPYTTPHYIHDDSHINSVKKFPCVLKINSEDVVHKSDVKGIVTGISNHAELRHAHMQILKNVRNELPKARLHGTVAFKQEQGTEIFIGMKKDSQFGHVMAFGLGGIFVEVMKDISLRVAPFGKREAMKMIQEIKAFNVLKGLRGQEPVNIKLLADMIVNTHIMCRANNSIEELDFNPVIADSRRAVVADVRIITR